MEPNKGLKFFNLDIIFLKTEFQYYDEINYLKNDIDNFNKYKTELFNENINNIQDNKTRVKRFKKHFYNLRNNLISYQKLKLIIIKQLRKDQNYHLIQLFKKMHYFKLEFKEYKYDEKLTKDKNISKISNFFATQKPLYFYDYLKERSIKKLKMNKILWKNIYYIKIMLVILIKKINFQEEDVVQILICVLKMIFKIENILNF